jgi:hypothetical protein
LEYFEVKATTVTVGLRIYSYIAKIPNNFEDATAVANSSELKRLHETVVEGVPDHNEPTLSSAFRPTEDTKAIEVNPNNLTKTVRIVTQLPAK